MPDAGGVIQNIYNVITFFLIRATIPDTAARAAAVVHYAVM